MNIEQLEQKIKLLGIPEESYYIHGLYGSPNDTDKLSMIIKKDNYVQYEIYYNERGEKNSIRVFYDEDEACDYFYHRLKEDTEMEDRL